MESSEVSEIEVGLKRGLQLPEIMPQSLLWALFFNLCRRCLYPVPQRRFLWPPKIGRSPPCPSVCAHRALFFLSRGWPWNLILWECLSCTLCLLPKPLAAWDALFTLYLQLLTWDIFPHLVNILFPNAYHIPASVIMTFKMNFIFSIL